MYIEGFVSLWVGILNVFTFNSFVLVSLIALQVVGYLLYVKQKMSYDWILSLIITTVFLQCRYLIQDSIHFLVYLHIFKSKQFLQTSL